MSGRKRKADDDLDVGMDHMSQSPSPSPAVASRPLSQSFSRSSKRARTSISGRPLALPRLLETLSPDDMRGVLRSICDRHPEIGAEIVSTAPRPTVTSTLNVLESYQSSLRESFPYGDRPTSEYAYNRVRHTLANMIDALRDYTPHFLPPNESQAATSLAYLDGATNMIHRLPDWESYQHDRHKHEAYEEISKAWALVLREAAKKGGGIQIQYGGWDQKLAKHNEISGGKMPDAMSEMRGSLGWIAAGQAGQDVLSADANSIRQQLISGTYRTNPIEVGQW